MSHIQSAEMPSVPVTVWVTETLLRQHVTYVMSCYVILCPVQQGQGQDRIREAYITVRQIREINSLGSTPEQIDSSLSTNESYEGH